MRFLVFQHIACEHPGTFRDLMARSGVSWDAVELDEGEPIPALEDYDALIAMGGPMDVWETDLHPWLDAEKDALRRWIRELRRPYLGVCLGHQLLADALGGACRKMQRPDVGITPVALTEAGVADPFCAGLATEFPVLQWHGVEIVELPPDSAVLASSGPCRTEIVRVGRDAYGVQGHAEITETTVRDWGAVPAYAEALASTIGVDALAGFERECASRMPEFQASSQVIFDNFLRIVRG